MLWQQALGTLAAALVLSQSANGEDLNPRQWGGELVIKTTHAVKCMRKSHDGDMLSVHYNGTLKKNGKEFDSSYDHNEPLVFTLGAGQVIAGWEQGLKGMCIGEERKLVVPPSLAYGGRAVGKIPKGSALIFQTKLVAIEGVDPNSTPSKSKDPQASDTNTHTPKPHHTHNGKPSSKHKPSKGKTSSADEAVQSQTPINPKPGDPDGNQGECRLLGPFALIVQAGLGLLAVLSLVWKRHRERPRRPFKIWFFDVSKQVFGSALLHVLNLLMSMISSADFNLSHKAEELNAHLADPNGRHINPCSFYLINIAIDTTLGVPILVVLLRILHHAFRLTPLARPVESIKSGYYGQPPRATWWLKQALIYFIALVLMKLCVFFLVQILPWIAWVGDWALRWTEGNEALQIAFVMFVFPLIMNALQYYIIDSFIKEKKVMPHEHEGSPAGDQTGGTYHSVSGQDMDRDSLDDDELDKSADATTAEVPHERRRGEVDEEDDDEDEDTMEPGNGKETGARPHT